MKWLRRRTTEHGECTSSDIASRAGVSKGAVSYALNERARSLRQHAGANPRDRGASSGWYPNRAARALSVARAHACGLVLARRLTTLSLEPFFMEFIAGVESELVVALDRADDPARAEDVDKEMSIHRRWWAERRVDGVLMVDLRKNDPRVEGLARLGMPAVVVGGPLKNSLLPCVWHDEASVIVEVVDHLAGARPPADRARRRPAELRPHRARNNAFRQKARALVAHRRDCLDATISPESGAEATRRLLSGPDRPTAIVYDSDVLAVSGLGVAQQMGLSVPGRRLDRRLGRLASLPGRRTPADRVDARHRRRTAWLRHVGSSTRSTIPGPVTSRFRAGVWLFAGAPPGRAGVDRLSERT